MEKYINLPLGKEEASTLRAGDIVYLTGTLLSARDAAHKRMAQTLGEGNKLPFNISGECIYYMGPSPAREGRIIGSAGPTTSTRMDAYTPMLLDLGLRAMIGKGKRSPETIESMKKNGAVYFAATGGAGALLSECITKSETICYEDLGTEAVRRLEIKNFPCIVAIDAYGNDLYSKIGGMFSDTD